MPGAALAPASSTCSGESSIDCGSAMLGQPAKTFGAQNGDCPVWNARAMNSTGGKNVDLASYGIVTAPESHGHAGTRKASAKIATMRASGGWRVISERYRRGIVRENPVISLLHGRFVPLRIDIGPRAGSICKRRIVETLRHFVCAAHQLCGALDARSLIARKPFLRVTGRKAARQHHPVLDRHVGALRQHRQCRMGGIAEERNAPARDLLARLAPEQRPFVGLLDVADQLVDVRVPTAEVRGAFLARALLGPGFDAPVPALDDADEVEQLAAPQKIVDHVAAGPDPVDADVAGEARRQLRHRDQSAPCDTAGELCGIAAEQLTADHRVHAVRADQRVTDDALAVREMERDVASVILETRAARIEPDRIPLDRAHRVDQHAMQVRAVDHEIGRTVARDRFRAEVEQLPGFARVPEPDLLAGGLAPDVAQRIFETQRTQYARAVRRDLHARAELGELRRLLVDLDIVAVAQQRERGRQPANARANDQDAHKYLTRSFRGRPKAGARNP